MKKLSFHIETPLPKGKSGVYNFENGDVAFGDPLEKLQRKYIREASSDRPRRKRRRKYQDED